MIYELNKNPCILFESFFEKSDKKTQHKKAYELLFYALSKYYNISDIDKSDFSYNDYGKPGLKRFPEIYFNISHCRTAAVCAIHRDKIGIDVENIRNFTMRVAGRICAEQELEHIINSEYNNSVFFKYWTLKESYVKMIGKGLSFGLRNAEFEIENLKCLNNSNINVMQFDNIDGYIISCCYEDNMLKV